MSTVSTSNGTVERQRVANRRRPRGALALPSWRSAKNPVRPLKTRYNPLKTVSAERRGPVPGFTEFFFWRRPTTADGTEDLALLSVLGSAAFQSAEQTSLFLWSAQAKRRKKWRKTTVVPQQQDETNQNRRMTEDGADA